VKVNKASGNENKTFSVPSSSKHTTNYHSKRPSGLSSAVPKTPEGILTP
jgi:hypothetical protein